MTSLSRYLLCLLLTGYMLPVFAQDKQLQEVRVRKKQRKDQPDPKLRDYAPGMQIISIDSGLLQRYRMQQLSQLLSQQVPVFIRSYGINSIATLNFRGSSAAQSQVLWNGVPLNNASLGMTDVSQLGVQLFDRIDIAYGGSSALLGSGNVGAAILLGNADSVSDSSKRHILAFEAGSFSQYKLSLRKTARYKGWTADGRIMLQTAKNNFPHTDLDGKQQTMTHARLGSGSAMLRLNGRTGAHSRLGLSAWYQRYDREIPAAFFEAFSAKKQQDASLRFLLDWHRQKTEKSSCYVRSAFFRDRMQYQDSTVNLNTTNHTYQYYLEAGWSQQLNRNQRLMIFSPVNISWMRPEKDSMTRYQYRTALAAAYHYQAFSSRLEAAANIRIERIDDRLIALPGLNAAFRLLPSLSIRANVQKSFRAPSLNELYYVPGGNKNLKPEHGWNTDAGYTFKIRVHRALLLRHELSVFNRVIHDWILWFGGSIWTPHNIASVHSRGLESVNSLQWQSGKWQLYAGLNTSFVLATTRSSYIPGDGSIGKQIPYTPRYLGQANLGIAFHKLSLHYNHTYTGYRFITVDESQFLEPFQTGNLMLNYTWQRPALNLSLLINNIWQTQYQVVSFRPMPGINYLLGASWAF